MRPKNHKPTSHDEDEIIDEFPTLPSTNVEDRFDWSDVNRRSKLQFTEETLKAHRELAEINERAMTKRIEEEAAERERALNKKKRKKKRDGRASGERTKQVRIVKNRDSNQLGAFLSNLTDEDITKVRPKNAMSPKPVLNNNDLVAQDDICEDSMMVATPTSTRKNPTSNAGGLGGSISDEVGTVHGMSQGRHSRLLEGATSASFSSAPLSHISSAATNSKGKGAFTTDADNDTDSSEDASKRKRRRARKGGKKRLQKASSSEDSSESSEDEDTAEGEEDEDEDEVEEESDDEDEEAEDAVEEEEVEDEDESEDDDSEEDAEDMVDETEGDGVDWDASGSGYSSSSSDDIEDSKPPQQGEKYIKQKNQKSPQKPKS
eukprot:GILI01012960.1.p1 GENE.GILI01012960.1~~GILI01012960.1.p1  ORF type:complete len:433 (-),score=83.17 GILI01012960.1:93-1220(-)